MLMEPISSDTRRVVHSIERENGITLALHGWCPSTPVGAIFYLHGLQSHAGWLWEAGLQFAANGMAFYVLDRRGCGISDGEKHVVPPVAVMMEDCIAALRVVRREIGPDLPLGLFGHCLGGSVLAGLLHYDGLDIAYNAAILCSAWLGRIHYTLSETERQELLADDSDALWDAALASPIFTNDPKLQHFIDTDPLAVRKITRASRKHLLQLEELYIAPKMMLPNVPIAYAAGHSDPYINLDQSLDTFRVMANGRGSIVHFGTDRHYLLFTDVQRELITWASAFTLFGGFGQHG